MLNREIQPKLMDKAFMAERSKAADSRSAGGDPARVQISSCAYFLRFIILIMADNKPTLFKIYKDYSTGKIDGYGVIQRVENELAIKPTNQFKAYMTKNKVEGAKYHEINKITRQ